jgi:hypothetical protein
MRRGLLEAWVLIDGRTACRERVVEIAGAAGKGYLRLGWTGSVVEAKLDRDAEVAGGAGNNIAEAELGLRRKCPPNGNPSRATWPERR